MPERTPDRHEEPRAEEIQGEAERFPGPAWAESGHSRGPVTPEVHYPGTEHLAHLRRIGMGSERETEHGATPVVPILGHLIPGAESCIIFFLDTSTGSLAPAAAVNLSQGFVDSLAQLEREDGILTAATDGADPYRVIYLPGNSAFRSVGERAHTEGVRTLWLVPWRDREGILSGALLFGSGQPFSPGRQAMAAVSLLTEWLSLALGQGDAARAGEDLGRMLEGAAPGTAPAATVEGPSTATEEREPSHVDSENAPPRTEGDGIPELLHSIGAEARDPSQPDAVSVLSHELLSPLTLIKGYTATLLQLADAITEEQSAQYLRGIQSATDRVIRLLEDLRDLSHLELTAPNLVLLPTALPELIREIVLETQGQTTKHVIRLRRSGRLPNVKVDRQKIEQVMTNLLTNAVKYSPDGGDIEIGVRLFASKEQFRESLPLAPLPALPCVAVTVADSGPGIPEADLERVFERFYRVNTRLTRATSGAGLGLHICKLIVQAHGGTIWASNLTEQGTVLGFTVPTGKTEPGQAP